MRKIKIQFVDFYPGWSKENNFITLCLKNKYEVEFSDSPDYLFFSCFGDEHLKYDCIKIYWTGEDVSPDFNLCDYAIAFDNMSYGDRYMRLPLFAKGNSIDRLQKAHVFSDEDLTAEKGFCSFVVSNGNANPLREEFFHKLSAYKKVASGGRFLNNVGGPVEDKIAFQSGFKFSIAFENDMSDGYTSEKILDAYLSRTIPIYWGNKNVSQDFNPESFINCHDFNCLDDVVEFVKKVDSDPILYQRILTAPIFKNNEIPYGFTSEAFERFLFGIFEQPFESAKRRNHYSRREDYLNTQKEKAVFFQLMHYHPVYKALHKVINRPLAQRTE